MTKLKHIYYVVIEERVPKGKTPTPPKELEGELATILGYELPMPMQVSYIRRASSASFNHSKKKGVKC